MYRCEVCRVGSIQPRYRKNQEPIYRCNNCGYRHWPFHYFAEYVPVWASTVRKVRQAVADGVARAAEELDLPDAIMVDAGPYDFSGSVEVRESWVNRLIHWLTAFWRRQ